MGVQGEPKGTPFVARHFCGPVLPVSGWNRLVTSRNPVKLATPGEVEKGWEFMLRDSKHKSDAWVNVAIVYRSGLSSSKLAVPSRPLPHIFCWISRV